MQVAMPYSGSVLWVRLAVPLPAALVAVTVNVYDVPGASPVARMLEQLPVTAGRPDGVSVQVTSPPPASTVNVTVTEVASADAPVTVTRGGATVRAVPVAA